jgi:MerR family transcriptional regulator, light-induced transcriptional regulator
LPETLYTLTQVVELAGIPSQTIYAWERRYGAVVPTRTATGRRVYTAKQLLRLKLLKACIEQGSRIGTIAHLSDASLRDIRASSKDPLLDRSAFVRHALALEQYEIDAKVGLALIGLGPAAFADEYLSPFIADVALGWIDERSRIAAEHVACVSAKSLLFSVLRLARPRVNRGTAVFATPEGELHELGLLAAAVAAQSCGIRVVYLGTQMPIDELAKAAEIAGAEQIVLASSILDPPELVRQVHQLRGKMPRRMKLMMGGRAFAATEREILPGAYFGSVLEFQEALVPRST